MSKYLRVQCDCGNEQVAFGDAKSTVKCLKCGKDLVLPQGGRAGINCRILEVLS